MYDIDIIYLQSKENSESEGRLWCEDSVYEDDKKYIRHDLHVAAVKELKELQDRYNAQDSLLASVLETNTAMGKRLQELQHRCNVQQDIYDSHSKICEAFGKAPDTGMVKININEFLTPTKED